jgi:hypothetical protein
MKTSWSALQRRSATLSSWRSLRVTSPGPKRLTTSSLQAFKAHPERYVPQYGGFCAFGVSVGAKFDGDPQLWKIVDGKLYLNLNPDIQEQWEKDIPSHIGKADKHWPAIKDTTPAERG